MDGGAADQRRTGADPRPEPAFLTQQRESPPPLLGERHGLKKMAALPIPDEILAEIFLRLPTPADLIRASAACVSFRSVAADRSFLRRFRKLHAPPFLGFLERERHLFHPAAPPHPSAPEASAAALVADFSFSFLPAPASEWIVRDIRDGRVLLDRAPQHDIDNRYSVVFPELVVCDPLHRRYLMLPPIPAHLTATVERPLWLKRHRYCETFLAPPDGGGDTDEEASSAEEMSFSVVWMAQCRAKLAAFGFSSSTGQWRSISSPSWSDLLPGLVSSTGMALFSWREYAYGCFYWVTDWRERLLVLDTRRMEFSTAEPPPEAIGLAGVDIAFVEAGEGSPGMFVRPGYTNDLKYSIRQHNCGGSSQWQFERTISLDFDFVIMGSEGRHLFLFHWGSPSRDAGCFSLDVKTFQLERVFVSDSCMPYGYTYSNFPPSLLSTPRISSGVEGVEKEMLEQGCTASSSAFVQDSADVNAGGQADTLMIRGGAEAATQLTTDH